MVIFAAAAAAMGGGGGVFNYNRENFFFDKEVQQRREFQLQEMQIKQFELYREDVRDLVNLTVRKMDNYLLVNTLQLGFCVTLFTDGRPKHEKQFGIAPPWLTGLYAMCSAGAFLYYVLSMWLAMHASISAHSFGTRLLTRVVRLPVATSKQLDAATASAADFEGADISQLTRIPLWRQQLNLMNEAMGSAARGDEPATQNVQQGERENPSSMEHVKLYKQLQANWQSYEAYARVCMAMGTNQVLHALTYQVLTLLMAENDVLWSAFCCVVIFTTTGWILSKLDLYLSRRILTFTAVLLVLPPMIATLCLLLWRWSHKLLWIGRYIYGVGVPVVYLLHVVWIAFITQVAKADDINSVKLPTNFRSVLYLDVYGWLAQEDTGQVAAPAPESDGAGEPMRRRSTLDSASMAQVNSQQRVRADSGEAIPTLAEEMPQSLKELLTKNCQDLRGRLGADFGLWQGPSVQAMLGDEPALLDRIRALRTQFDEVAAEVAEALPEASGADQEGAASSSARAVGDQDGAGPTVWLRLVWNPSGQEYEYWYDCATSQTVWEEPAGNVRISGVESLEQDICALKARTSALVRELEAAQAAQEMQFRLDALSPRGRGKASRDLGAFVSLAGRESMRAMSSAGGSADGAVIGPGQRAQASLPENPDFDNPRAGGREPARAGLNPGILPWDTVKKGSMALMMAWGICFVWVTWAMSAGMQTKNTEMIDSIEESRFNKPKQLPLARSSTFMASLARPDALACSTKFTTGASAIGLLASKYQVTSASLDGSDGQPDRSVDSILKECVNKYSKTDVGIASVTLDCQRSSCSAVVLQAAGRRAYVCPLSDKPKPETELAVLTLHGGPYAHLTFAPGTLAYAPKGVEKASPDGFFALEVGGRRVVKLEPSTDDPSILMPQYDLPLTEAVRSIHFDDKIDALLGLSSSGMIFSWPMDPQWPTATYSLLLPPKSISFGAPNPWAGKAVRKEGLWRSLCTHETGVYLLAESETQGSPYVIWNFDLG